jgi:hypothetical protein
MKKKLLLTLIFSAVSNFLFSQIPLQNLVANLNLGISLPSYNYLIKETKPNGLFGADINYRFIEPGQNFLSQKNKYEWGSRINFIGASLDFHTNKISPFNKNSDEISSKLIKLQFSNFQGSGYLERDFKFYPYYNSTLGYNYFLLNPNKNTIDADEFIIPVLYMFLAPNNIVFAKPTFYTSEQNMNTPKVYNNKIKMGSSRETGFIIQLRNELNLKFGYECTIIYPQYIWLQNQTSNLIESSIQNLFGFMLLMIDYIAANEISSFSDYIINSFISVGFQNLRKSKMHWPLNSDKPLYYDSFKLGIGIQL